MSFERTYNELCEIYPVSRETFQHLQFYVKRLEEWQAKTNLVAPSTLDAIWTRHIADSLQCYALKPEALSWVDIGSGGGLPGMVINAMISDKEGASLAMIESNQKKCSFLRQINRQIGGVAEIYAERIESAAKRIPTPEIVTARALASLQKLFEYSSVWLEDGAVGLFHKGRDFERELAECDGLWSFDLVCHSSKLEEGSVILEISNLKKLSG